MCKYFSRLLFIVLFVQLSIPQVSSQTPARLRSTLSVGGLSKEISLNGTKYYVQQSLGQSSIIGPRKSNNNVILQGFIQPSFLNSSKKESINSTLDATIFPNPLINNKTTIYLKEKMSNDIVVNLYDIYGRSLKIDLYDASIQELAVDLSDFAAGVYILKIQAGEKRLATKLIKN